MIDIIGRGEKIRTSGPCLPKAVLYQAELHPEPRAIIHSRYSVGERQAPVLATFVVTRRDNSLHEATRLRSSARFAGVLSTVERKRLYKE